jgi:hypothetical protein
MCSKGFEPYLKAKNRRIRPAARCAFWQRPVFLAGLNVPRRIFWSRMMFAENDGASGNPGPRGRAL